MNKFTIMATFLFSYIYVVTDKKEAKMTNYEFHVLLIFKI